MQSLEFQITTVPPEALGAAAARSLPARLAREGAAALGFPLLTAESAGHASDSEFLDRAVATAAVARQNPELPPPPIDANYVIAGQQAGLLGGPLYTILKAIAAIGIARRLSAAAGHPLLPLFWIATEDHDILEVNRVTINGRRFVHQYRGDLSRGRVPQVGGIPLADTREPLAAYLYEALPETEFRATLIKRIAGLDWQTYGSAFRNWLHDLFAPWQLRLIDPRALRTLTAPVLAALVERWAAVGDAFAAGSAAVRGRGFTPPLERPGFFEIDAEGHRVAVEIDGQQARIAGERHPLRAAAELIRGAPAEKILF